MEKVAVVTVTMPLTLRDLSLVEDASDLSVETMALIVFAEKIAKAYQYDDSLIHDLPPYSKVHVGITWREENAR